MFSSSNITYSREGGGGGEEGGEGKGRGRGGASPKVVRTKNNINIVNVEQSSGEVC